MNSGGIRWGRVRAIAASVLVAATVVGAGVGRAGTVSSAGAGVTIHVNLRSMYLHGGMLVVTAQVADPSAQNVMVTFEGSSDGRPWRQVGGPVYFNRSGRADAQEQIDRNTRFRVHLTAEDAQRTSLAYSATRLVCVWPVIGLLAARRTPSVVEVTYHALVHPVRHAPRRRVFVYIRHPGQHLFHLVLSRWLSFQGGLAPEYFLDYRLHDSRAGAVLACTRVALLADMGKPFTSHTCGRPTRSG